MTYQRRCGPTHQVPMRFDPPRGITYGFLPSFSNFSFRILVRVCYQRLNIDNEQLINEISKRFACTGSRGVRETEEQRNKTTLEQNTPNAIKSHIDSLSIGS